MKLHLQSDKGVTLIENTFIDQYMPRANGEYVKLYLYLLRCASSGRELSVSSIADFFDHTEKDVQRALKYWEKLELLRLEYDQAGGISDISFLEKDGACEAAEPAEAAPAQETDLQPQEDTLPDRSFLTASYKKTLAGEHRMQQLLFVAQQYLGRPITSAESDDLMYYADGLHFSEDLIEYLIEYCAERGNTGRRYVERVAQEWYREGITTVAQAKGRAGSYGKSYYAVMKAFGITSRTPAPSERKYMDRWITEYALPLDVVEYACSKTVLSAGKPSFAYADRILKNWAQQGLTTLSAVQEADAAYAAARPEKAVTQRKTPAKSQSTASYRSSAKGRNSFNNFPQRDYDWKLLEQQLVNLPAAEQAES